MRLSILRDFHRCRWSLVVLSRSCLEQATMIVQFDARHIWGCRVSPSTPGIFAGGVGRRVPMPGQ